MNNYSIDFINIINCFNIINDNTKILDKNNLNIKIKDDKSEVCDFDLISDKILQDNLPKNLLYKNIKYNIEYLSEESLVDYNIRKNWLFYWSVDPLDGTKNYIKGSNLYTINISLIHNKKSILGFIYLPYFKLLIYNDFEYVYYIDDLKFIKNKNELKSISEIDDYYIKLLIDINYKKNFNADEFDISALCSIVKKLKGQIIKKEIPYKQYIKFNNKNLYYKNISIIF